MRVQKNPRFHDVQAIGLCCLDDSDDAFSTQQASLFIVGLRMLRRLDILSYDET